MLNEAHDSSVQFVQASGESLPFAPHRFDLVTVALAFHWLDRDRFLAEARRVLRTSGWLVIHDNFFLGRMKENPKFERWQTEEYLKRYPVPPRDNRPLTPEVAGRHGLLFLKEEWYTNDVTFSSAELSSYLMSATNVLAAVQAGTEDREEIRGWLADSVGPLFPRQRCTFCFGGYIRYLRCLSDTKEP
jgi:SAM-dependent methyltransferase